MQSNGYQVAGQTRATSTVPRANTTDDYERWYTEATPNNRMLLSLRSGIDSEISWALDRLCRLCHNEQFLLRAIPGLADALFEWPEWYVQEGEKELSEVSVFFALPREKERRRRHALESLFILRNSAMNEPNAQDLASTPRARRFLLSSLHSIHPTSDANVEFLLYTIELLQSISGSFVLPQPGSPPESNPIPALQEIIRSSSNRSLIIASLVTLTSLHSIPANAIHLKEDAPSLEASMNALPLILDKDLIEAALNYLYAHLSYAPMTKAFLFHPRMLGTLRLLVALILEDQIEETVAFEVGGPVATTPAYSFAQEDFENMLALPEPKRCYEWMKAVFFSNPEGEMTQVDFWTLYKDTFSPYQERFPLLVASDVIKNVSAVFPSAQAMVLPGPTQRFVIRGVDKRQDGSGMAPYKCRWDRNQCPEEHSTSTNMLYEHTLEHHIGPWDAPTIPCLWGACEQKELTKAQMRGHVLTHLPTMQLPPKHPSQPDNITLPMPGFPHPVPNPTERPPPPARSTKVTYMRPHIDPPPSSLTALLLLRVLFRASFASADAAPRVDENHFGFPGTVEDTTEEGEEERVVASDTDQEGEHRGRKAFIGIRYLLEDVRMLNDTFQSWIMEMVDSGVSGALPMEDTDESPQTTIVSHL